ncbi:hypothetical protein CCP4SC76_2120003 [Gammaproteobacteria bacterium]
MHPRQPSQPRQTDISHHSGVILTRLILSEIGNLAGFKVTSEKGKKNQLAFHTVIATI